MDRDLVIPDRTVKQLRIHSEKEFDLFLSNIKINKENIDWGVITDAYSSPISEILYSSIWRDEILDTKVQEKKIFTKNKCKHLPTQVTEFWNRQNNSTHVNENIYLICSPKLDNEFWVNNFWIYRIEEWDIRRSEKTETSKFDSLLISREYNIFIPGLSLQDIVEYNGNTFNRSVILKAIGMLSKFGLIKSIRFGGEVRYVIVDEELHHYIVGLKEYFTSEIDYLLYRWRYLERPTDEELSRMESIFGKEEFKKIETLSEIKLHEHKQRIKTCNNIDEYNEVLKEGILGGDLSESMLDRMLDRYKRQRRITPLGKKDHRRDIEKYRTYIKREQETQMERLSICCRDHNEIERFKIDFKPVIEKYSFLRDMINKVCHKVLDPPDEEIRNEIRETEESRKSDVHQWIEDIGGLDLDLMYDHKNKKAIPHTTKVIKNKEGKQILVRTVDFDNFLTEG